MKKQQGSATVLALVTMTIIGILIAGFLPMTKNEVKMGTINKDVIEAQYAAEAGAKRAIAGFSKSTSDWDWTWIDEGDIALIDDVNKKKYNVAICLASDFTKSLTASEITSGQTYIITSTGTVGSSTKTVSMTLEVASGGGVFSKYTTYSEGNLTISNSPTIAGDIGSGGNINITNNPTISGRAFTPNIPVFDQWNPCLVSGGYYLPTSEDNLIVSVPPLETLAYNNIGTQLTNGWKYSNSNASGNYYTTGAFELGKADITAAAGQEVNIYINGNWTSGNNTTITGNDITIYVNGAINLSQTTITGNNITIYATNTIDINGSSSITQASSNGTVQINTPQNFYLTNSATINSETVTINAGQAIDLNNQSSINKNSTTAITKIYASGDVNISNHVTLGGSADLVESLGKIQLSNNVNLLTTVFMSDTGASTISNGVDLAAFYTNGTLDISNAPNITYNDKKTAILDNLGLGGGGTPSIIMSNWKII